MTKVFMHQEDGPTLHTDAPNESFKNMKPKEVGFQGEIAKFTITSCIF